MIQYTARTFGYARIPDVQTLNPSHTGMNSKAADEYSKLFSAAGPMLRLGMGDNFAPNLLGRVYQMPDAQAQNKEERDNWCHPGDPNILVPKDRFFFDPGTRQWVCANDPKINQNNLGKTEMEYDNVAEFFTGNHYNALVPGKHDFYFGPEWLRDAARLLARGKVHMLGANLYLYIQGAPGAELLSRSSESLCRFDVRNGLRLIDRRSARRGVSVQAAICDQERPSSAASPHECSGDSRPTEGAGSQGREHCSVDLKRTDLQRRNQGPEKNPYSGSRRQRVHALDPSGTGVCRRPRSASPSVLLRGDL